LIGSLAAGGRPMSSVEDSPGCIVTIGKDSTDEGCRRRILGSAIALSPFPSNENLVA